MPLSAVACEGLATTKEAYYHKQVVHSASRALTTAPVLHQKQSQWRATNVARLDKNSRTSKAVDFILPLITAWLQVRLSVSLLQLGYKSDLHLKK